MTLKWIKGRQGTGYDKLPLIISRRFKFDSYILRFPVGTSIPTHKDPVALGRHFRLNIILKRPKSGGEFKCEQTIIDWPRVKLFRPDKYAHCVSEVSGSNRYVLSVGWLRPELP
ncbi:2OG-Fe(II) oxygenase [Fretibacter rubidus]|uniref:2OG-Fe(II) oxygenase n=1 Tax=Fretibacter rubidus TaxID=570162 RepID=UPI003529EF2B